MAGNKLLGNPSWPRIPEAALQLRALRNRHVSAVTVINPPTAIYFSFQTTCESPELCVRVDPWQPQINITLCFMNEKKETQGIHLKAEQSKAGNPKRPGALLLAFNKRQPGRGKGPGPELEDLSLTHTQITAAQTGEVLLCRSSLPLPMQTCGCGAATGCLGSWPC